MSKIIKKILPLVFLGLALLISFACSETDLTGTWKLTLKWDKRAVFQGEPPPPNIFQIDFKEGKLFMDNKEIGDYRMKRSRVKLKITKMKIICYGEFTEKNHLEGEISYYPASEIYGTWTAERI
jgi:hypothetical protein